MNHGSFIPAIGMLIRHVSAADRNDVRSLVASRWGASFVIKHDTKFELPGLPGLIAEVNDAIVGLLLWVDRGAEIELLTLDALVQWQGIGGSLLGAFTEQVQSRDHCRVLATVTNDQLVALRLLQLRGFRISAVRPGAVDAARKVKPQIPVIGNDGVPLHDELDLVLYRGADR
jgi:GNAT superfamily N-acetyltransferase